MTEAVDCAFTVEGSGPPLILVHGIGASRDAWRFVVEGKAEMCRSSPTTASISNAAIRVKVPTMEADNLCAAGIHCSDRLH